MPAATHGLPAVQRFNRRFPKARTAPVRRAPPPRTTWREVVIEQDKVAEPPAEARAEPEAVPAMNTDAYTHGAAGVASPLSYGGTGGGCQIKKL